MYHQINRKVEERHLIKLCLKSDMAAQKALYDKYAGQVYTVCRRYALDDGEAQDILQETFITAFRKLDTFKFKGPLVAWLRAIAVNKALRYIKSAKRAKYADIDEKYDLGADPKALDRLGVEEIMKHVQNLPNGYREVFNLHVLEGFKHAEIAEKLGIGESTSRSQLTKARKMLQKSISSVVHMVL